MFRDIAPPQLSQQYWSGVLHKHILLSTKCKGKAAVIANEVLHPRLLLFTVDNEFWMFKKEEE